MFQGPKVLHIRCMVGGIAAGFMFACRLIVGSFEVFCVVVSVGCLGGWHSAFWRLRVQSCSVEEVLYSIGWDDQLWRRAGVIVWLGTR